MSKNLLFCVSHETKTNTIKIEKHEVLTVLITYYLLLVTSILPFFA